MSAPKLTVTISGGVGVGKTTLACEIAQFLMTRGDSVTITDDGSPIGVHTAPDPRPASHRARFVAIFTEQTETPGLARIHEAMVLDTEYSLNELASACGVVAGTVFTRSKFGKRLQQYLGVTYEGRILTARRQSRGRRYLLQAAQR